MFPGITARQEAYAQRIVDVYLVQRTSTFLARLETVKISNITYVILLPANVDGIVILMLTTGPH